MGKKNEKWVTVMGKHLLVSGNGKTTKSGKKTVPTAKFDEINRGKKSGKK